MTDEHDPDEDAPELATNEAWREIMVRARKHHGLTQGQLGALVGVTQVMVSKIETGESGSSTAILAICRELSIPVPEHFADERSRNWADIGHVLRQGDPDEYAAILNLAEATAKRIQKAQVQTDAQPVNDDDRADRRK